LIRQAIIDSLSLQARCSKVSLDQACERLHLKPRQIYYLIQRYRQSGYQLSALIVEKHPGGKNQSRLPFNVERLVADCMEELYLNKQRFKVSTVYEEIIRRCHYSQLKSICFTIQR